MNPDPVLASTDRQCPDGHQAPFIGHLRTNVLRGMGIPGRQDRERRLYELAGEVAKAIAHKANGK